MRQQILGPALACAVLSLAGCDIEDWHGNSARYNKDFQHSYGLKPDGRVTVEGFNGSIEVSGWDQDKVDISGTKYAPTPELLESLKIDIDSRGDAVHVRAIRPSSTRGNMGVKFAIKVPRRAQLERVVSSNGNVRLLDAEGAAKVRTSNGSVRAQNLKGALDAQTSNGTIEVLQLAGNATLRTSNGRVRAEDVRGGIEAVTSNGSINVKLEKMDAGRNIRLETSNGGVDLTLPRDLRSNVRVTTSNSGITLHAPSGLNARVSARTTHGSATTDLEVKREGDSGKSRLEGTIGSGGSTIDLQTTNGSIRLLRM
jgi:hypothetical protein